MIITQRLHGDHLSFKKLLKEIEDSLAKDAQQKKRAAFQSFALLAPLLKVHERCEEEILFPFLIKQYPAFSESLDNLTHEHHLLHEKIHNLHKAFRESANPLQSPLPEALPQMADFLHKHIHQEDDIVFPKIEQNIDHQELERLSQELTRFVHGLGPITRLSL